MTDQGKVITEGLSEEIWQKLSEDWGTEAKDFRKLNFIRDYHGPYKHYIGPLEEIKSGEDNDKISLLEIRYGSIPNLNSGKPCVWFLLRHDKDPDGQISTRAQLQILLHILEKKDRKSAWVPIAKNSPDDVVNKATQHGPDTYALAAKIIEPNEWPGIVINLQGKLERGEPLSVRMQNSQPFTNSRIGGIWVADDIPF